MIYEAFASLVDQMVRSLLTMRETWIQSLSLEDPLQKSMATHSSIIAWRIPWMEKPGGLHRVAKSWMRLKQFSRAWHEGTYAKYPMQERFSL